MFTPKQGAEKKKSHSKTPAEVQGSQLEQSIKKQPVLT